jgi:hypothetical protein
MDVSRVSCEPGCRHDEDLLFHALCRPA